jgi:hypothetical protein
MPATNAQRVHPARPAVPVPTVPRAVPASQVNQAKITELAQIVEIKEPPDLRLLLVKAHLDLLVQPAAPDPKAHPVQLAVQAKEADKVHLVHQDLPVQREAMANQVQKAHLEPMLPEEKARKDPKDQTAQSVHPVPKDPTDHQQQAAEVLVNLVQLDHPAHLVRPASQENKDHKVPRAIQDQMPNTAHALQDPVWSIVAVLSLFSATSIKKATIWNGRENFIFYFFPFSLRLRRCRFDGTA